MLLCVLMIASILPVSVLADEPADNPSVVEEAPEGKEEPKEKEQAQPEESKEPEDPKKEEPQEEPEEAQEKT